ncbi:MAG: Spi family protease inhibitor, partial [Bacteroidales bacterium]|nr:Spi family protease inhibitor [Bacteroidales bacterium]
MRRFLLTVVALLVFAGQMFAAPVDVMTAKKLGVKYLKNNVASAKSITDVDHVYTVSGDNGVPSLYVFNYENGYVIVAADDRAYPILAYSEESIFDVNHLPDGLVYYLGHYSDEIQYAIENDFVAEEEIAEQWELLRTEGITSRTRMDRIVNPLITTKWNQDYPYNYY